MKSKLPNVGTTIFTVMSKLAKETEAINLSQGFPDFACSPKLIELVNFHMKQGRNQYSPMGGVGALRERIAEKVSELYGADYDPDTEITVTAGATQAIYTAITTVVRPGDEVIVFEPAYDCYVPAVELSGGVPVHLRLKHPDYHIDWSEVNAKITPKTRLIVINTPHNPTGAVLSREDINELKKTVAGTNILLLSDEVYEHIVFDGQQHHSFAHSRELAERSFLVSSFGKVFHNTGWKVGYCLAPRELMAEFRKIHQFMVFCINTPMQHALADFLKDKDEYLQLNAFYQEKRDYFNKLMEGSRFKFLPSAGTYFQSFDYGDITREADTEYAIRLTKEAGVVSIPVSALYHDNVDHKILRFCFAKSEDTLRQAAERLCKI